MKNMKKMMALMLALTLLVGAAVGGTIAWLLDTTEAVTNTFTVGKVELTLVETQMTVNPDGSVKYADAATEGVKNEYPVVPGTTYRKDPVVTVGADSEKCYLFVKFDETADAQTYLTYTSTLTTKNGWTQGTGTIPANVWYRIVEKNDTTKTWNLLDGNTITIKDSVTKENMATAAAQSLIYTAYAVQYANVADAAAAWAQVAPATP